MCFSPEADLVAGAVVGAIGIGSLRHVRRSQDRPLAAVPGVLGAHLLVEVPVWWGQSGEASPDVARAAVALYLLIALVVLPVLVPAALWASEPAGRRRTAMAAATAVGGAVAALYLSAVLRGPIGAEVEGHHLVYTKVVPAGTVVAAVYVLVTCGPLLASSHRRVVAFGAANLVAVAVIDWVARSGLTSLWCAWAAVTSLAISAHVRDVARPAEGGAGAASGRVPRDGALA